MTAVDAELPQSAGEEDQDDGDDGVFDKVFNYLWPDAPPARFAHAPCLGLTDLFYGERVEDAQTAVEICKSECQYVADCLESAIAGKQKMGVWGGVLFTGRGPRDPHTMSRGRLLSLEDMKTRRATEKATRLKKAESKKTKSRPSTPSDPSTPTSTKKGPTGRDRDK